LKSSKNLRKGWLVTAGIVALYLGAIHPSERARGINNSRATGLAAYDSEPLGLWRQARLSLQQQTSVDRSEVTDDPVGGQQTIAYLSATPRSSTVSTDSNADRKVVRTSAIEMIVQRPAEAADKIRVLANSLGGFLVSSQIIGGQDASSGSLTIRVPAPRFEEARDAIRKLGLRVESERVEAEDVTRQYVDQSAGLRNLRAEEEQYLLILKQARTVKDTLEVTEKLSEVRGHIEQQQAEFVALSKQIQTVSMMISLRAEADARVFGLNWRPLFQIKMAFRDGLEGLASYASTMTEFLFFLPTVILWLATILIGAALGWRILRWIGRWAFRTNVTSPATQG
jgi:hypothetical protein